MPPTSRITSPTTRRPAAVVLAIALCMFCSATATVAALPPRGHHRQPVGSSMTPAARREAGYPAPGHSFAVYPGPVSVTTLRTVEIWWNRSGADVRLTIASSPPAAQVVITPYMLFAGTEAGVTSMPCIAPCRPDSQETITLSSDIATRPEFTLAHELGHAMGLGHSHVSTCSIMAPIMAEHCDNSQLPRTIP